MAMRSWRLLLDLWMQGERMCRAGGCEGRWAHAASVDRERLVVLYQQYADLMPLPIPATRESITARIVRFAP